MDCGGKQIATPLFARTEWVVNSGIIARPKAMSPLPLCHRSQNFLV
jgi:hypothetical protein